MVTSKDVIAKIRRIIDKHHNRLVISVLGNKLLSKTQLKELKTAGYDISNVDSLLEIIYNHNFINPAIEPNAPTSVEDMKIQQKVSGMVPQGEAHSFTIDDLDETVKQHIEKLKLNVSARIEGIIRQNNNNYKKNALQNLNRLYEADQLIKESSLAKVKQQLKDTSGEANRDWQRVALTEMSNAVGIGSVDRIVSLNADKDLGDVYVFRVIVGDDKTCKYCRRFYQDADGSPVIYTLSHLLAQGSNYGKKTDAWTETIGATHPNTRTSQIIELPKGWKVEPGGKLTFIGQEKWNEYIHNKVRN